MYSFDKIVAISDCGNFAVILMVDMPPSMARTRRTQTIQDALIRAKAYGANEYVGRNLEVHNEAYVAVQLAILRQHQPGWGTKEDLLKQYEAMQREDIGPIKDLNLREHPELLDLAKKLWAERLVSLRIP